MTSHDISKEFRKNIHFKNMTAGFLLRCQNLLRQIPPKMMHFQAWKNMILTNNALYRVYGHNGQVFDGKFPEPA
jgi:hypothetical protein